MRTSMFALLAIGLSGCGSAEAPSVGAAADVAKTDEISAQDETASAAATPIGPVSLDVQQLANARTGDTVELDLGAAGRVSARTVSVERLGEGRYAWSGRTIGRGVPDGEATLIVDGASVTGSVRTADGVLYRIRPSGQGNAVERVDSEQMPPD